MGAELDDSIDRAGADRLRHSSAAEPALAPGPGIDWVVEGSEGWRRGPVGDPERSGGKRAADGVSGVGVGLALESRS